MLDMEKSMNKSRNLREKLKFIDFSVDILIFNKNLMNKSASKAKFDVKPYMRPGFSEE